MPDVTNLVPPPPFVPVQQSCLEHVDATLFATRKGLKETTKALASGCDLVGYALGRFPKTAVAGDVCLEFGSGVRALRSTLKLVDVVGELKGPKAGADKTDTALHYVKTGAFIAADVADITLFLQDRARLIDLPPKTAQTIGYVGNGCAALGLGVNIYGAAKDMGTHNSDLTKARNALSHYLTDNGIRDNIDPAHLLADRAYTDTAAPITAANLNLVENRKTDDTAATLAEMVVEAQGARKRDALEIAQSVFDVVAIIFGFVVSALLLPMVVALPVMAILGLASAFSGLWKIWDATSVKQTELDLSEDLTVNGTSIARGTQVVNFGPVAPEVLEVAPQV